MIEVLCIFYLCLKFHTRFKIEYNAPITAHKFMRGTLHYMIGQQLGNYQVIERLGVGGMGAVYLAAHMDTHARVVIKHLHLHLLSDTQILERFQREGQALAQLNHPNIVKQLDTFFENGQHYLVMEYVAGGSLADHLQQTPQLPIKQILKIGLELADALTRTHHLNIIHRDLKPANVLIAEDGTPRLTDFGIARMINTETMTEAGMIIGTLPYMPPEALKHAPIDHRADLWAFGVMLFEMLAGKRPYQGEQIAALIRSILQDPIPDLEKLRPDAPIALVDLTYRLLDKDPLARISSARIIGAELEAILKGQATDSFKLSKTSLPNEITFVMAAPPTPTTKPQHNLPAQLTPFVGRETELIELTRLFSDPKTRLVTILAAGGMGKTRLSQEFASQHVDDFTNGAYFIGLAPLTDTPSIIEAIAAAVGLQFGDQIPDRHAALTQFLRDQHLLLILDNFEHILKAVPFVIDLLENAPDLYILVTSREKLNIGGEQIFQLGGMNFPDFLTPDDALNYSAVKLFMQSATRVQPSFEITSENLDSIVEICQLVHGMPLGILLAAAWLDMFTPVEIVQEIQSSLDFLETDRRDLPERHRSIRAVFDYSWQQLTKTEQNTFMQLSICQGGFTRQAAQKMTEASLRVLMALVNKSLLRRDPNSGRYEVHELLRQYAEEKLRQSGQATNTRNAHADYYLTWFATLSEDLKGRDEQKAFKAIIADLDNLLVAWHWAVEKKRAEWILPTLRAFHIFIDLLGKYGLGVQLFSAAREQFSPADGEIWWRLVTFFRDDSITEQQIDDALAFAHQTTDNSWIGDLLQIKSWYASRDKSGSMPQALQFLEEAEHFYTVGGDEYALMYIYEGYFHAHRINGDIEQSMAMVEKLLQHARKLGNKSSELHALNLFATGAFFQGKYDEAYQRMQEIMPIAKQFDSQFALGISHAILSNIYVLKGEFENAHSHLNQAMEIAKILIGHPLVAIFHYMSGFVALAEDRLSEAEASFREALTLAEYSDMQDAFSLGLCLTFWGMDDVEACRQLFIKIVTSPWLGARRDNLTRTALVYAYLTMVDRKYDHAAQLFGTIFSEPIMQSTVFEQFPFHQRTITQLKNEIGENSYEEHYQNGQTLDFDKEFQAILATYQNTDVNQED